ncbi:rod shape-determining protein [Candidatus Parcubacteria bacterium]|jgi:rod shape-determining protein MreB|nr:MAG: rod shape-determining protein [Candidatus Parcubacteria bacterium]GIW68979.1 MAG: rod shape-determining protein [Candidatus Parcubacteria bacterium]
MKQWVPRWIQKFVEGADVGIDLGTATTLVYVRGRGIVVREPSVVALNLKTGTVVAVGAEARAMLGRTPQHLRAVRPIVEGVISEFDIAQEMMRHLLARALAAEPTSLTGPRVVIGVPTGITTVEIRAVRDAAKAAGAREVHIIEEPVAAAIGLRLPIKEAQGSMVVDIGGGTTDIAVLSLGGVVESKNLRIAGDTFDQDIAQYLRNEFKLLVGEKTAEEIKWKLGAVRELPKPIETVVRGRDLVSGLPREVAVTDSDIREAIAPSVSLISEGIREVVESTPPEVLTDIMERGAFLVGGGALLRGLPEYFRDEVGLPFSVAPDPLLAVVRGTAAILEDTRQYADILITHDEEPIAAN